MNLLADGLLIIAAVGATAYCFVLSRRLSNLSGLDQGLGRAILDLSERVDAMNAALSAAKAAGEDSARALSAATAQAEAAEKRLGVLLAGAEVVSDAQTSSNLEISEYFGESTHVESDLVEEAPEAEAEMEISKPITVIRDAPDGEEDEAFAKRLVDALTTLQPQGAKAT